MQSRSVSNLANASSAANRSSSSLITPAVVALADAPSKQVDTHLYEFLMADIQRVLQDSEAFARKRREAEEELVERDIEESLPVGSSHTRGIATPQMKDSKSNFHPARPTQAKRAEADEGVTKRLDEMGFKLGWALVERLARDRARFPVTGPAPISSSAPAPIAPPPPTPDALEVVKFVCKDVWTSMYDKQIDNLRTNHRGVYVLQDNGFKPLMRMSGVNDEEELQRKIKYFLAFPCGIIRGVLANLDVQCTVTAECPGMPQTTFQIKTLKGGAI